MKKILFTILCLLVTTAYGQKLNDFKKDENWFDFKMQKTEKLKINSFTKNFKTELGLTDDEVLTEKRREKDNTGRLHVFYHHYLNGIEIEGSELILHSTNDEGFTEVVNDKLTKKLTSQPKKISENDALKTALSLYKSNKYAWQDSSAEEEIKEETQNPNATNFPKANLVYAKEKFKPQTNNNYQLCYRFIIYSISPFYKKAVYISAVNGKLFKEFDLLISCNVPATATTLYNGNQQIITDWKGWPWNRHILIDCNNRNIHTKYGSVLNPEAANGSTTWGTNHQSATSCHWASEVTWDLYRIVYGRNGTNNSNREVKGLVDFPGLIDNAYYDLSGGNNDKIRIGRTSNGNRSLSTLDIVGHEITHGLTRATANLVYEGQSGALNESFSDIFGFMVERRGQLGVFDWRIGEDAFQATGGIRDLLNPNLFNQPSFVGQPGFWTGDNAGVHTNSGVPNRWFSILSNGGFQNGIAVNPIGIDNAARVAWNTLVFNLGQNSNFNDARNASINVARWLFGECSNEVIQVTNAWAAVGVGAIANPNCITLTPSSIYICYDDPNAWSNFPITITANFNPVNGNIFWNIPADFDFIISGNFVTINSGPLTPNISLPITATLTSNLGNPVTATTWYNTYQCYGGIMRTNKSIEQKFDINPAIKYEFNIFPNPVTSEINIITAKKGTVNIIDLNGRIIFTQQISIGSNKLNVSGYRTGIYIIQLLTDEKMFSKKVIIQH